jgi:LmbE family N-acetylglucosaminyl deacetylase
MNRKSGLFGTLGLEATNIACIVSHPDDEVLGVGGTIARAVEEGANVRVVLPVRRFESNDRVSWSVIKSQFIEAVTILGATPIIPLEAPHEFEVTRPHEIIPLIEPVLNWADVVLTHWRGDLHETHRLVSSAVDISCRPIRRHLTILQFEVPSATDQGGTEVFAPNFFVQLNPSHIAIKNQALMVYKEELGVVRNPEHITRWGRVRGEQVGWENAEAFVLTRAYVPILK